MQTTEAILAAFAVADRGVLERVRLSPLLYPRECVELTLIAFGELCSGALSTEGDVSLLSLSVNATHQTDAARVVGEFFNHALGLSAKAGSPHL